ncbi:MAG: hypothetical protein RLO06_16905 [Parvibaculum sp.]
MGTKPKTRFTVIVDEMELALFSIRELPNSSLVFISNTPENFETDNGWVRFAEQHYSVHKTNGGKDTQITQKTYLEDKSTISNTAFILGTDRYLLWPIHGRRLPKFRPDNKIKKKRHKDRFINIGSYDTKSATLIYTAFVTKSDFDETLLSLSYANRFSASFSEFKIVVFASYLNIPTPPHGEVVGLITSDEVVNGDFRDGHRQFPQKSLEIKDFPSTNMLLFMHLREKMLVRLNSILDDDHLETAALLTSRFFKRPLPHSE